MVTASFLAALLSATSPTHLPPVPLTARPPAQVRVVSAAPLADVEDQGVGRGLRNMLLGGVVGAVGVGILMGAGLLLVVVAGAVGLAFILAPPLAALWSVAGGVALSVAGLVSSVLVLLGMSALLGGIVWFGVNSVMVLLRLSPDYKPGPATDYLPM